MQKVLPPAEGFAYPPLSAVAASARVDWVDSARGVGIVLVVQGHVWRGLESASLIETPGLFKVVDGLVYSFHMPFLFFVSGIFFQNALLRQSASGLAASRATRLLWPLALWTWVYFLFKTLAGELANSPVPWEEFPLLPLPPREQFWFLWALFVIQMSAILVRPILIQEKLAAVSWATLGALAMMLYFGMPGAGTLGSWVIGAMLSAPFFIMGVVYGRSGEMSVSPAFGWLGCALFIGAEVVAINTSYSPAAALLIGAIATLSLTAAIQALECSNRAQTALGILRLLGKASLAIYVTHVIFTAGIRISLIKLGVDDLWLHVLLGILGGLLAPLALYLLVRRIGGTKLAGF